MHALRKLASRPGSWISPDDIEHIGQDGIGNGVRVILHTAIIAKLRLLHTMGEAYCRGQQEHFWLRMQIPSVNRWVRCDTVGMSQLSVSPKRR